MSDKKVFISYSHDSDEHRESVLSLSERLRADGIETLLDQYVNGSPQQGWPRWMLDQLDTADTVLIVCTETYYRRFRGHEEPGKGKGVDWEGALITQEIYEARSKTLKFVPVFLSAPVEDWIPEPLRSSTHYSLTSASAYQRLYDFLLGVAGVEAGAVGTLKERERRKGTQLTFDGEGNNTDSERRPIDISRIIKYAPAELIGRETETKLLSDGWDKAVRGETKRPHVLTFVALGGEGKTSLVAKWAADLAFQDWLGCDAVFAWSFYSQGMRESASSDLFLKEALIFFGDRKMAESSKGSFEKGRRLSHLVGEKRALLILDGIEPLQYAPSSPMAGELKDQGIAVLLKRLATASRGLCVVTTRYELPDLRVFWQTTSPQEKLPRLSTIAGVVLLRLLGVSGTDGECETLVEDVKGHALTLNLLGSYLRDAYGGDVRKRDLVRLQEADAEEQGGHAFRVMDSYVKWFQDEGQKGHRAVAVLRCLALFDRPASADCFAALTRPPAISGMTKALVEISEAEKNMTFAKLESARLISVSRDAAKTVVSLDTHPLLREYFGNERKTRHIGAWQAAHQRIFEHLGATTPDKPQPTLEDLQPLYEAVVHGCQAGLIETALPFYNKRIRRGRRHYASNKLGAWGTELGAITCFFEIPWSRVSPLLPEIEQAWLISEAAHTLRALGRLTESIELRRASFNMGVRQQNWIAAARRGNNLSELELSLGEIATALDDALQSVMFAERSGDGFLRMALRTTHADILHQAGRSAEAETRFREAEQMQAERQPDYPFLYSLQGFNFCDLILSETERVAWQMTLVSMGYPKPAAEPSKSARRDEGIAPYIESCSAVSARAAQTLKIGEQGTLSLLTIGLDHLTLARAALYAAILTRSSGILPPGEHERRQDTNFSWETARREMDAAVDGLRQAASQDHIPRGLLARAWLRFLTGAHTGPDSAQADLDEAWEIAERGPMPLFMADIHLHRARLFGLRIGDGGLRIETQPIRNSQSAIDPASYPWKSLQHDLAEARRLIVKHGYLRRMPELEDAEAAIQ